ncbi:S6OS1 protein, partial [Regulus satrapa]|nr:S6OS1 protein [Regulus satrapa]
MDLQECSKKYTETARAQKYYKKCEEVEEIQKRVLKCLEKYKWKDDACLDNPGTAIVNAFTIQPLAVASMRKKTQETLQLAEAAAHETIQLEKEAEEFKMKIDYLKKTFKEAKERQNNSEKTEGKSQKSLEKPEEFKERVFEERERPSLPKEKHQVYKTSRVPHVPWKFVQPVESFRVSKQQPEAGREEKEKPVELSVAISSSSSLAENLPQVCCSPTGKT